MDKADFKQLMVKVFNKDLPQPISAQDTCQGSASTIIILKLRSVCVELTELKPFCVFEE